MAKIDYVGIVLAFLQKIPPFPKEDVDSILKGCSHCREFDQMMVIAVRYRRIDCLLQFEENGGLSPAFRHLLRADVLVRLARDGLWTYSWDDLLSGHSEGQLRRLFVWMSTHCVNSEALTLFEMLLGRFESDGALVRKNIEKLVLHGLSGQYTRILCCANNLAQHLEDDSRVSRRKILDRICISSVATRFGRRKRRKLTNSFNDMLLSTCQAGLFSADITGENSLDEVMSNSKKTPIFHSMFFNQPDMVRFLYSTGTFSNRAVFQMSRNPDLLKKCAGEVSKDVPHPKTFPKPHDARAAREIQSFLVAKASTPRSLKSMCLTEVSRGLGWGKARTAAIKEMEIPQTLKVDLITNCEKSLLKYRKK